MKKKHSTFLCIYVGWGGRGVGVFNGGTGVMIQINRSTANCVYITELRKRRRNYLAAEKIMRNKRVISFSIAFPLFCFCYL